MGNGSGPLASPACRRKDPRRGSGGQLGAHVGIIARELAERGRRSIHRADSVAAGELQRWLLEQEFAVECDGLLQPTEQGIELGATLEFR